MKKAVNVLLVLLDTVPPFRVAPELAASRLTILDSTAAIAGAIMMEHGIA